MGEEVKNYSHDTERVTEWEIGLPTADDLTPLSQPLIPPELASAFSISPEPYRTLLDVNRASNDTISALRSGGGGGGSQTLSAVIEPDEEEEEEEPDRENGSGTECKKLRRLDSAEDADSNMQNNNDDPSSRSVKRPRLVWTPQLHKRFVDVVAHLGIKNAVPKTIMQLMNVEGLTRENVASHLQKYRLYLKRMQGLSNEGPSSSDQLFASTPVPQSLHDSGGGGGGGGGTSGGHSHHAPIPMPYPPPHMMAMLGMPHNGFNNGGFQQRDWSSGFSYPHHAHGHGITPSGDK
ncbi:hypothetical protein Lal_00003049 [Lupinus albus]|uniref:Putative transcription factor MYB-HB-like family n=1 Tax=Lupinus albus TaxID=3870 RepID=A0A6A4NH66_LUPAL|nr:putative transcription factor MYB-HB-like family [Lupinus albus]KAF1882868.1 hypothetical protein Lal_00003049 [Lupinus albus]